ncbi:MAG: LysR family transcriptional regulator [Pseudomonadota bacterium]
MPRSPSSKDLSLKGLELFQLCAKNGSLQAAAKETGLTLSTVSHHLRSLEAHLGVALFNHARRPMILTPKGQAFLRNIEAPLYALRKAKAEAAAGSLAEASLLRIGTIEDFDSDIAPELAVFLSQRMPNCDFVYQTEPSHTIIDMLRNRHLDVGITTTPADHMRDVQDRPLLRDPFVMVVPKAAQTPLADILNGRSDLPFLRFSSNLIIARQIASQMRRLSLASTSSFECSNNQTLMAMVAAGAGWTITTPLLFARARRFHAQVTMHPFPGKQFSRSVSIVTTPDCSTSVTQMIDGQMRGLLTRFAIAPQVQAYPWLAGSFDLITDAES